MSDTALYRKWRSQTFADLVGQQHVSRTLLNALARGRVGHAYLFCGPRGIGKTSIARILAKAINCETNGGQGEPCNECRLCREISDGRCLDVLEIDGASNNSVDNIRDLREKVQYTPTEARFKVYIIDEVHRLSGSAFDALLKTLEEPPAHAKFIFASTERHRIPATILSRCQRFDLRRISLADTVARLAQICEAEGIDYEPAALELIGRTATGSLRDATSLLDQLRSMAVEGVTLQDTQDLLGTRGGEGAAELARTLADRDIAGTLRQIDRLNADGIDFRQLTGDLIDYLRGLLLIRTGSGADMLDVPADQRQEMAALAGRLDIADLVRALKLLNELELSSRTMTPQLPLELALVEAITGELAPVPVAAAAPAPVARPAAESPRPAASRPGAPAPARTAPPQPSPPVVAPAPEVSVKSPEPNGTAASPATREVAAPAPRPAAMPAPPSSASPPVTLAQIREQWRRFIETMEDKRLQALMRDTAPRDWDGTTLTCGVLAPFHRERLSGASESERAEAALWRFFGTTIRVKYVLGKGDEAGPPDPLEDPLVKHGKALGFKVKRVVRDEEA